MIKSKQIVIRASSLERSLSNYQDKNLSKMCYTMNYNERLLQGPSQKVSWNFQFSEVNISSQSLRGKAFQEHLPSGLPQSHSPMFDFVYIKDYPEDTFFVTKLRSSKWTY